MDDKDLEQCVTCDVFLENKRLREVLKKIAKMRFCCVGGTPSHTVAEQALKESNDG